MDKFNVKGKEYLKETQNLRFLLEDPAIQPALGILRNKGTGVKFAKKYSSEGIDFRETVKDAISKIDVPDKALKNEAISSLRTLDAIEEFKNLAKGPISPKLGVRGSGPIDRALELAGDTARATIPAQQQIKRITSPLFKTFKGIGRANLLQRAADGSYTEESKKTLTGGDNS